MPRVAVVVPFFQRVPGGLAAAVGSALSQRGVATSVIVVDDASPVPAEGELARLPAPERARVSVIAQPNAGPGPARNSGLDAVSADTEFVAFLDSDDVWMPDHLPRALRALDAGYDFFFGNSRRAGQPAAHFTQIGFDPDQHAQLASDPTLRTFTGDFFTQLLRGAPVGTSTVVYRRERLGRLRFADSRDLWEDLVFWLDVAALGVPVAFDPTIQVHYGVGGFTHPASWKSNHALGNVLAYDTYFRSVGRRHALAPEQVRLLRSCRTRNHAAFAATVLGMVRSNIAIDVGLLRRYLMRNPSALLAFPPAAMRGLAKALAG